MSAVVTLSPGQLDSLAQRLADDGVVRFDGLTFRIADPVGTCPACSEPVYSEDEQDGPVWTCPADLSDGNPWQEPAHEGITDELREASGVYSNCGEDYGFPCYEPMPLHAACYDQGGY